MAKLRGGRNEVAFLLSGSFSPRVWGFFNVVCLFFVLFSGLGWFFILLVGWIEGQPLSCSPDPDTSSSSALPVSVWMVMVPCHTRDALERQQLLPGVFSSFCFDGGMSINVYLN